MQIIVAAVGIAVVFTSYGTAQQPSAKIPFARLGAELFERSGLHSSKSPQQLREGLLDQHFVRVSLGIFDLRYPADHLKQRPFAKSFAKAADAVIRIQEQWLEWAGAPDKSILADLNTLRRWIRSWKPGQLAKAIAAGQREILTIVQAKEKPTAAAARFASYMRNRGWLQGVTTGETSKIRRREADALRPCRLLLSPTREHFTELVGAIGMTSSDLTYRKSLWSDITNWTHLWFPTEDTQVIVLESPSPFPKDRGDFTRGFDMNTRSKTGMVEHVAQRAGFSIVWYYWGSAGDPMVRAGIAQNLSIASFGRNNTPSGDVARILGARSVFIPGAPAAGGALPPLNADSRWRQDLGKDHFIKMLRRGQKSGAKNAKARTKTDKQRCVLLQTDDAKHRHVVRAPFLGTFALRSKKIVPKLFLADYLQFHRAYKSGFVHWLRTNGGKSKADSVERFSRLMQGLSRAPASSNADSLWQLIYGVPLSTDGTVTDCLEWRFLAWLSKH